MANAASSIGAPQNEELGQVKIIGIVGGWGTARGQYRIGPCRPTDAGDEDTGWFKEDYR